MEYTIKEYFADKPLRDYFIKQMNVQQPESLAKFIQKRELLHFGLGMLTMFGFWLITKMI